MSESEVPATEFKAKCLALMDRVAERHESYTITKWGKPVARLVPAEPLARQTLLGCLAGRATITGDIVQPGGKASAWQGVREWDHLQRGPRRTPALKGRRGSR